MGTTSLLKAFSFIAISSFFGSCEESIETIPSKSQNNEVYTSQPDGADLRKKSLVLVGSTQGVFRASSLGESFKASDKGLSGNSLIVQGFLEHNNFIYAATKNGVYVSKNDGKTWSASNGGMSGTGLNVVCLFAKGDVMYAGTFRGGLYTSTNGKDWTSFNNGLAGAGLIVRAFIDHDNTIYIGTHNGVYKLSDAGTSWQSVSSGLNNVNDLTVVGLASTENSIYAATFGGLLKELKDNTSSWITLTNGLDDGFVNAVAVVGDKLYVGGNTYGVYIYDGNTFVPFDTGLPSEDLRIRAFAVKGNQVLMGTINTGTYYTTDGITWVANSGEADNADNWGLLLR